MNDYIFYGGRIFRAVSIAGSGYVSTDTIFRYDQREDVLIGSYSGGDIEFGSIVGTVHADGRLSFLYHHITKSGDMRSGSCESRPEWVERKLRLHESWQWHGGAGGSSIIEEL